MAGDGGPAFPGPSVESFGSGERTVARGGMSLRDYFATHAMAAYLSAPSDDGDRARQDPSRTASWAYENADAMLAAREGK